MSLRSPSFLPFSKTNMAKCRSHLPDFTGSASESKVWYKKFNLLATKHKWEDDEKCVQLGLSMTESAGNWFATLSDEVASKWDKLRPAFEKHFLNTEPPLVLESRLQSRVLSPSESTEDYYSSILALGAALNRSNDMLTAAFLNGLPENMKEFIIGTDSHTLDNYMNRARLFVARHPVKTVKFENQFPVEQSSGHNFEELQSAIVGAVTQSFEKMYVTHNRPYRGHSSRPYRGNGRSRTQSPGYRSMSPGRSSSPGRSMYQRSSSAPRGNYRGRFQSRGGRTNSSYQRPSVPYDTCFRCRQQGHWIRDCPLND